MSFIEIDCIMSAETANNYVNIFTEETPNPATLKFITTKLLTNTSLDFATRESAEKSPMAKELFKFNFVNGVFITANFVTITKVEGIEWFEITSILRESIKSLVEADTKVSLAEHDEDAPFTGSEIDIKIQQILNDYVRPAVESDGGAITFKSFHEGLVTVELRGSCSGCPSSTITLKSGIEALLKRMVPEVTEVVADAM